MAMNAAAMKAALLTDFISKLKPIFDNIADDHTLTGKDFSAIWSVISEVIADNTVATVQTAKATGTDSHGDSHNLDIA